MIVDMYLAKHNHGTRREQCMSMKKYRWHRAGQYHRLLSTIDIAKRHTDTAKRFMAKDKKNQQRSTLCDMFLDMH